MTLRRFLASLVPLALAITACQQTYAPKPYGYHRIDLPKPAYQQVADKYPYRFEVSQHAQVIDDTSDLAEPHWVTIHYPQFEADVQLTYKPVNNDAKRLNQLMEDARKLTAKHQVKASGIEEFTLKTDEGQTVYLFALQGEVPTQLQFYTTDSSKHFLRGALYFRTASKNDSLQPVIQYISKDMEHMLHTLHWK